MSAAFSPLYEADGTLSVRFEGAEIERPDGSSYRHHRLVVADGRPGIVVAAHRGEHLLFVRSLRVSTGLDLWELPRGSSEIEDAEGSVGDGSDYSDDTLVRAGLRELSEETGYEGQHARIIGRYFSDTTMFPQRMGTMYCEVLPNAEQGDTDGEVDEQRWFSMAEVSTMLRDGTIRDSHTLCALAYLRSDI